MWRLVRAVIATTIISIAPSMADEADDELAWIAFDMLVVNKACEIHRQNLERALSGASPLYTVPEQMDLLRKCDADRLELSQKLARLSGAD